MIRGEWLLSGAGTGTTATVAIVNDDTHIKLTTCPPVYARVGDPTPKRPVTLVLRGVKLVSKVAAMASEEWTRIANEPATDEEIASYKRHERCDRSCLGCLEKFRLIARLEAAERALGDAHGDLANAPDGTHCRSCCYLEAPCDEHKEKCRG